MVSPIDAVERLFPKGLAGIHAELLPHVARVLDAAGIATVDAYFAEDPRAAERLTESTVLWMATDLGLAQCQITLNMRPPARSFYADPATLLITPWAEVRGARLSAKTEGRDDPITTLTLRVEVPELELSVTVEERRHHPILRALARSILSRPGTSR
jgi:hypothetical protein